MKQTFTVTVEGFDAGHDVADELVGIMLERCPDWKLSVEAQGEAEEGGGPRPLVSILLPNYNYGHRIERMLRSIRAQTVKDVELIVVDDGSSDDSIERIRPFLEPRDRLLLHGKNRGAAAAINTAARYATGKFMTWVSSDNEMTPDWLAKLLASMASDVGVSYANYDRFNEQGAQSGTWGKAYDPTRLLADQNCFIGPAFLIRSEVWRDTGELRGKNSCDYDHWLRIEETCMNRLRFVYLAEVLCHYYSGPERATVARKQDYDAGVWQAEARKRRGVNEAVAVS
jgi:glycosyltransferase involved in cell wall biosynthesis